ncbi:MAG: SusC/RagA family TonB-linked outer membrane protein, partial [Gemmatimonadetes bacterium]|nr:SusC/RagA family TonB-linked outer membrane protein [Gemmatimonadota bacterium]
MRPRGSWSATPLYTLITLLLAGAPAAAQAGQLQGTVVSATTEEPLAGAQVFLEGTSLGALSNDDGRFLLLNVPTGDYTVTVRLIGYADATAGVTIAPGQTATLEIQMRESALALDEIVVTGTAAGERKRSIGNSMAAISARDISLAPVTSSQDAIQGRAPGVAVMTNSGQVGAGYTVKIRGINSVSQDTEPLIYVDGIRIFNLPVGAGYGARTSTSPLQDINADDIERIEIVKGAAATTLYGTEASSGVIQIFTKRGYNGAPQWSAEIGTSARVQGDITNFDDDNQLFTQCAGLMQGIDTGGSDKGTPEYFVDPTCPDDGDWWETGWGQNAAVSVRGGTNEVNYYASANYSDLNGTLPTQGSTDGGVRGNFSFRPVDWLGFQLNTAYTKRDTRWVEDGNNADGFLLNVGRGYRGYLKGGKFEECTDAELDARFGAAMLPAGVTWNDVTCSTNAYLFESETFTHSDHYVLGFNTNISPTENWSNTITVGWDYTFINSESTHPFNFIATPQGYFIDENTTHTKLALEYAGSLRSTFFEDLASTFSWGGQIFRDRHRWTRVDVRDFAGPVEPTLDAGARVNSVGEALIGEATAGFFLQEQLGWQDRLFVTGGVRVDGNSAFGDDFGFQVYPKLSGALIASDYDVVPDFLEQLKLRAAYGLSGKAPGAFDKLRTWSPTTSGESRPAFTPGVIGNEDLGPETTRELEWGLDAGLWDGRLGIEFTRYDAVTSDALVGVTLPPSMGWLSDQKQNIGRIEAGGWELGVVGGLLRTESFEWTARFNGTWQSSDVTELGGEEIFGDNKAEFRECRHPVTGERCDEGYPAPGYFGRVVINPNEIAAPEVVRDTFIGNVYPTKLFSVGSTIQLFDRLTLDG